MNEIRLNSSDTQTALKMMRSHSGLSQGDIAKRAKINRCFLSMAENGKNMSMNTLRDIAQICSCEIELVIKFGDKK